MNWKTIFIVIAVFFSSTAFAQITAEWSSGSHEHWTYDKGKLVGAIAYKKFHVISGSGYIDLLGTLVGGMTTANATQTIRMWVEAGIEYEIGLSVDWASRKSTLSNSNCFRVEFDAPAFSGPTSTIFKAFTDSVGSSWCPTVAVFTNQEVDEFQLNASYGTFADHVRVTWNEIEGSTEYQVFRCTDSDVSSCGTSIGSTAGNGFDDTGGTGDVRYWYRVKACATGSCSDFSEADKGYRYSVTVPVPPTTVTASDGTFSDKIAISWSVVAGATSYNIYFSSDLTSEQTLFWETTNTSGSVVGTEPGVIWYFWVYAENAVGESASGTYDTGFIKYEAPDTVDLALTILKVVEYVAGEKLIIENKTENIGSTESSSYSVSFYVSADTTISSDDYSLGFNNRQGLAAGDDHHFTGTSDTEFESLPDGTYYIGAILNIDDADNDNNTRYDPTPITVVAVSETLPDAPTLESVAPGNGKALLYFTANGDGGSAITGYTASCGAFDQAGASSPITVSGLTNGTEYLCSVIATNVVGESAPSNTLSVTPVILSNTNNELSNIATRADVGTGNDIAIAGFIIAGSGQKCVIVRGRGPSVGVPAGVIRLPDPTLTLKSGQTTIAENDNWTQQDNPDHVAIIEGLGKAPGDLLDAAIYICLDPGAYTVLARGYLGTTGVGIVEVLDVDDASPYLRNIATRAKVGTGHLVTIAGFIITGNTPKQILIRGRGPSVGVPAGVTRLANPTLTLKSGQTTIGSNDNWEDAVNAADISATGKAPGDPLDSAIMMVLQPGAYTAILRGAGGTAGVGIVEVLDLTGRQ